MKKITYFILPAFIAILLFTTAFTCSLCSSQPLKDFINGKALEAIDGAGSKDEDMVIESDETSEDISDEGKDGSILEDENQEDNDEGQPGDGQDLESQKPGDQDQDGEKQSDDGNNPGNDNNDDGADGIAEEVDSDGDGQDNEDAEEDADIQDEDIPVESENTFPTLNLVVYEGPLYSAADDVCYYRVEAKVTGNPQPEVDFSKDDSNGAWGAHRVQVNLKQGQEYTLTAIAKNSEGQVQDELVLQYTVDADAGGQDDDIADADVEDEDADDAADEVAEGDDSQDDEGAENQEPEIFTVSLPKIASETGYFVAGQNGYYQDGGCVFMGDAPKTAKCPQEMPCTGYVSFDLSGLAGKRIVGTELEFRLKKKWGDPSFYSSMMVLIVYNNNLIPLSQIPSGDDGSFVTESRVLSRAIQVFLMEGKNRMELYCQFDPYVTDHDNSWDGWEYDQSGISLKTEFVASDPNLVKKL